MRVSHFDLLRVHLVKVGPIRELTAFDIATDKGPSNLVMIMGANGCGKTTLLDAIFAAMAMLSARSHAAFGMEALDVGDGAIQLDVRATVTTPSSSAGTGVLSIVLGASAPLKIYTDDDLKKAQADLQETLLFHRARDGSVMLLPASDPDAVHFLDALIDAAGTPALTLFGQELELPTLIYFPTSRGIARASAGVRGVAQPPNLTYRTALRVGTDGADWATSIDNLFVWYTWLQDDRGPHCRELVNDLVFKGRPKRLSVVDRQNLHTMVETEDGTHRIDELSHGERQLLQFVVRIASHMTRSTIVMIDEAELHLHFILRRRLIGLLKQWAKNYPGLTFILTSHQTDMLRVFLPKVEEEGLRKGGFMMKVGTAGAK